MKIIGSLAFAIALLNVGWLFAAPGDLDLTFNPGSRVNDFVYSVASQPDGKIIIGGLFTSPRTLIARLNTNGSIDTNFNVGTGANGIIYSIAVQPDGKILIGGAFSRINGVSRNRIARLNADGSLDTTFNPGLGADDLVRGVALQTNGQVIIVGDFFEVNLTARIHIARLNADGGLDASFDPGSGADQDILCVAVQPNGKILIGGYFQFFNDVPRGYVARLNANGSVDDSFDPGSGADLDVDAIAAQSDGKVVLGGGFGSINGMTRERVARLHSDGSVDESFDPGLGVDFHVGSVTLQSDGKLLIGGNFGSYNGVPRANIARVNSNGSLDSTFNPGNGTDGAVYTVGVADGKVLLGGAFKIVNGATRNYFARLNGDGGVDTGFNTDTGADYPVLTVAPDEQGRVLVGGYFTVINNIGRNYIARLNSDGSVDSSFNPGLGANNRVTAILPAADGKVLIGGLFTSFDGTNRGRIARLTSGGQLDLTFDSGAGANSDLLAVAPAPGGKVLMGGEFTTVNGTNRNRIARLNANGSLDLGFEPGSGANATVSALASDAEGKVIVAGDFLTLNGTNRSRIGRLDANGSVDLSFNPGAGANAMVEAIALQSDGRILVAGQFTSINGTNRNRIARLHPDGSLDLRFNPGSGADGFIFAIVLQADGKVVVAGDFFSMNGLTRRRLARLHSDGSLDLTFNPLAGGNDTVTALALQTDGKLLMGGFFNSVNGVGRSALARFENDLLHPTLGISRAGQDIVLSWPAIFNGFALETTTNFQSNSWNAVEPGPSVANGRWVVTNAADSASGYFRLKAL